MDKKTEEHLEFVLRKLKAGTGSYNINRLRLNLRQEGYEYRADFLAERLKGMELIEIKDNEIKLTQKGWEFDDFETVRNEKNKEQLSKHLSVENLQLQNENLNYANSLKDQQAIINGLTIENLTLQNRQLRRQILFSIIGFIAGAILTNYKEVIDFLGW
ncbi:MAG: hypothetical protein EOO99_12050 [Pedobacter sp.]|nr:MAG: hypothetical protein EOO99_12050 [Pedobacter sp.]